ncbi:cytochrome c oxidase subunit 6B2-like [Paramacrobiotus metropolitanus]|uniref:cytochrome c oxidase subunit 6B2-like n=1 Tax=Paramacrobiotus metropolitanus TaxID=2943436 RepID=UPI002445BD7F|nr:cytochrome c oxidase subunit 6B2-like [Paramacrobiotus metropolitanus]
MSLPAHEEREENDEEIRRKIMAGEFWAPPFDPRFPNQNQAKRCWVNYLDYQRCKKLKGEDYEPCYYFKKVFRTICPHAWVAKWNEQLEAGTLPFDFEQDLREHSGEATKDHGKKHH